MFTTVGGGLIYTLDVATPSRLYIRYQIVAGTGLGLSIQVPVIAAQMTSPRRDVSVATSTVLFFQFLGTAIGVSTAQSIFNNRLLHMTKHIDGAELLSVGAYNLRGSFRHRQQQLDEIMRAYVASLRGAWVISVVLSGLGFVVAFLLPWRRLERAVE